MTFEEIQARYTTLLKSYDGGYSTTPEQYKLPLSDAIFCATDIVRNKKFHQAITQVVQQKTSPVVVDAGCGTGILGLYALIAGAKQCVFIEHNPETLTVCKSIIKQWGYTDQSVFILGNAVNVALPKKRDILVSETLSSDCVTEDFHRITNHLATYKNTAAVTIPACLSLRFVLSSVSETKQKYRTKTVIISTNKYIRPIKIPPHTQSFCLDIGLTQDIWIKPGECMSLCGDPKGVLLNQSIQQLFTTNTLVMAGGGSGGHVRPIQSLIEYIDTHYHHSIHRIIRYGEKQSFEHTVASELQQTIQNIQLTFVPILAGKFRREKSLGALGKNIRDMVKFGIGWLQSLWFLATQHTSVVFCKGGFVALPVIFAAKMLGKKIILHESDTHAGLTNRVAHAFAAQSFTGFAGVLSGGEHIGQILSDHLIQNIDIDKNPSPQTTIMVTGGSLGALALYQAIGTVFETLQKNKISVDFRFIVLGGLLNKGIDFVTYPRVETHQFVSPAQMGEFYHQADLCITRAGTTTLAETKLFGCTNIIVPLPWTHDQADNAKYYANHYGDIVLDQTDKDFANTLYTQILHHTHYKKEQKRVSADPIHLTKQRIVSKIIEYL